jgi:exodeoxyribonuclease VII small subunit
MPDEPGPPFEEALTQLEGIVCDLERGEPALSAALAKYGDGVKLLRRCYQLLDEAERSVGLLSGVDPAGNPITEPFDASATRAPEPGSSSSPGVPEPRSHPLERSLRSRGFRTVEPHESEADDPPF